MRLIKLSVLFLLLTGCAVKEQYALHEIQPKTEVQGQGKITVVSFDHRLDILMDEKKLYDIGSIKALYGNPLEVKTASKQPLGLDISKSVCKSFINAGFDECEALTLSSLDPYFEVKNYIRTSQPDKLLQITINDWECDTFKHTEVQYDLEALVYDRAGNLLTKSRIDGKEILSPFSNLNPAKRAVVLVPESLKTILENLLNKKDIVKALNNSYPKQT